MNILLINPPNCGRSIPEERFGIDVIKMIFRGEPLALETLAGNLPGHDVVIIDLKADPDGLSGSAPDFKPDLIGITGVTCEANTVLAIARKLKQRYGVPVVVGGHHASCDPDFFKHPFIDYIVVGLGKQSFRELVDGIEAGRSGTNSRSPVQFAGYLGTRLYSASLLPGGSGGPCGSAVRSRGAPSRQVRHERYRREGRLCGNGLRLHPCLCVLLHSKHDRAETISATATNRSCAISACWGISPSSGWWMPTPSEMSETPPRSGKASSMPA